MEITLYLLQRTSYYFSMSMEDLVDSIEVASTDRKIIEAYIEKHGIVLGEKRHLYDSDYEFYTLQTLDLEITLGGTNVS